MWPFFQAWLFDDEDDALGLLGGGAPVVGGVDDWIIRARRRLRR